MKRLHVHVAVADLAQSIRFYSTLFDTAPTMEKPDYAKWMLDDPRVNFAISTRGERTGVDHLGMQAEDAAELELVGARLRAADAISLAEKDTTCCYARSDKYWTEDPQGVRWENFHTHGESTTYAAVQRQADERCCDPEQAGEDACCEGGASGPGRACCDPKDAGKPGCCA